ncbi:MAG TPA: hypothetical protein VMI56_22860 [Reyranella sp.]|nr:hypothetical protein [Reyranella sp.]
MAVDMALSLRQWHDEPIAIAGDAKAESYISGKYPGLFDHVVRLPALGPIGHAHKFSLAEVSPFRRSMFIDADTIVLGDLRAALAGVEDADFAMIGEFHAAPTDEVHHGIPVRTLIRDFGLDRYFSNHSGAFVFDRSYGRRFLAECMDVWRHEMSSPLRRMSDELSFGVAAARRGMVRMAEPYPCYWTDELRQLRPDNRWKPLCHLFKPPPPHVMAWLMAEVVARRRQSGLASLSVSHWTSFHRDLSEGRQLVSLTRHWLRSRWLPDARVTQGIGGRGHRKWKHPNLLLGATTGRPRFSTPNAGLALYGRTGDVPEAPVAVSIHCWPEIPEGLRVMAAWVERGHRPVLVIEMLGPLPAHPEAVACIRFGGRRAGDVDCEQPIFAGLRATLVSPGSLRGSVLAAGAGSDYFASSAIDREVASADQELPPATLQRPASEDELFLEFRLRLAGLEADAAGVRIEFSCFFLSQEAEESPFLRTSD